MDAIKTGLSGYLPLTAQLYPNALAQWRLRCVAYGYGARRLLSGLLRVSDGPVIRRGRDEPVVGSRYYALGAGRETRARRGLVCTHRWCGDDGRGDMVPKRVNAPAIRP